MAGNSSTHNTTPSDIKRLVNEALSKKQSKRDRKQAKSDIRRSTDAPNAIGTVTKHRGPIHSALNNGGARISNSEFVADISSGGPILSWDLNPISGALFTWLARVAIGYEMFRFTKLQFVYTPVCSSTTVGVVVMAPDYDASDALPANKQALSAYSGSVRGSAWNTVVCDIDVPAGWYFVGNGGNAPINPAGTDIKFYDIAKFVLGVFNAVGTGTVGELTVNYVCEFAKPDYGPIPALGESIYTASPTLADPVGSSPAYDGTVPVTIKTSSSGAFKMTFGAPGYFMVQMRANTTTSSATPMANPWVNPTVTNPDGTSFVASWSDSVSNYAGQGQAFAALGYVIINAQAGSVVQFATQATVTALSYLAMKISSYSTKAQIGG